MIFSSFSDSKLMRQRYVQLHQLNKELIGGYRIRTQNQQTLIESLKQINVIIQKAANLRGELSFVVSIFVDVSD